MQPTAGGPSQSLVMVMVTRDLLPSMDGILQRASRGFLTRGLVCFPPDTKR